MLTSTFVHIRQVSPRCERSLWEQGALTWLDFLDNPGRWKVEYAEIARVERSVANSMRRLENGEHQYFAARLPKHEHWRAFPEFRDSLVYLDIETAGGFGDESITVVGMYDGIEYKAFVRGDNLFEFPDAISKYSAIVTFFGAAFDVPMLQKSFPTITLDQIHIDLCPVMRRVGYRGGLKSIERQFGIERSEQTTGLTGRDAVRLWRRYVRGDDGALEVLLQYNKEDVVNLERLMESAYMGLREMVML